MSCLKQNKLTELENSIKALNEVLQAHMNTAQKAMGPLQISEITVSDRYRAAYWVMSKVAVYKQSHMLGVNTWYKQSKRHLSSL